MKCQNVFHALCQPHVSVAGFTQLKRSAVLFPSTVEPHGRDIRFERKAFRGTGVFFDLLSSNDPKKACISSGSAGFMTWHVLNSFLNMTYCPRFRVCG